MYCVVVSNNQEWTKKKIQNKNQILMQKMCDSLMEKINYWRRTCFLVFYSFHAILFIPFESITRARFFSSLYSTLQARFDCTWCIPFGRISFESISTKDEREKKVEITKLSWHQERSRHWSIRIYSYLLLSWLVSLRKAINWFDWRNFISNQILFNAFSIQLENWTW